MAKKSTTKAWLEMLKERDHLTDLGVLEGKY
jgi:hypothetical protein